MRQKKRWKIKIIESLEIISMTRKKKQRSYVGQFVTGESDIPTKEELLADPNSKESLKKKALEQSKKRKSVYQKELDKQQAEKDKAANLQQPQGGRLADKIRANAKAKENEQAKENQNEQADS
jgi:hypothetical protein